nr:MAG TPA: hypothetical protein [Caudoviricetes sp.]
MQSQVYINQALGQPGTISRENPCDKIPVVAEGSAVVAGGFVFEGTDPEIQVIGCSADTASKTAADIAGVAVLEGFQLALGNVTGMTINEGHELAKVRKGYVYVVSNTASVHDQNVIVNPSTGVIETQNITYTTTVSGSSLETTSDIKSGFIDTGWLVETGGAAGQVCEIYKI